MKQQTEPTRRQKAEESRSSSAWGNLNVFLSLRLVAHFAHVLLSSRRRAMLTRFQLQVARKSIKAAKKFLAALGGRR
jgi:hypothetical protein